MSKSYLVEYNGKCYGTVEGDNEDEAEFSAFLKIKASGIRLVNRGFLFLTVV